jgi:hypothetical protein
MAAGDGDLRLRLNRVVAGALEIAEEPLEARGSIEARATDDFHCFVGDA